MNLWIGVVEILAGGIESPMSWARAKLAGMTARDADWSTLNSAPPNRDAERLALKVLVAAHSLLPLEPSYVTASAEGGVGIVYRDDAKYAAFECLNSGELRFLWFDVDAEPHSKRLGSKRIYAALKQIQSMYTLHAGRS
jgi:hypothetical protein